MAELFLELFSEEIPAGMQALAIGQLKEAIRTLARELDPGRSAEDGDGLKGFAGPRRLAVAATIAAERAGSTLEVRGPKEAAPDAAVNGFLRKHGAEKQDLVLEDGYHVLRRHLAPEPAFQFIEKRLPELIAAKLEWPKSMRWGQGGEFAWVRPIRRIVCLLDREVVPIRLGPVTAGNVTEGHRVMGAGAFEVVSAQDWEDKLRQQHFVMPDAGARESYIATDLARAAEGFGVGVLEDDALVREVAGLVEWPVALVGKIDEEFMALPPEVRELSMKVNQKYFSTRDAEGQPAPYFVFVANLQAADGGAAITAGNERVLRARLSDARHFWDLDLKTPLDELLPKLEKITFHAKIGTQLARSERISELAGGIAGMLGAGTFAVREAEVAGRLAKADLVTGMVGEFPELQGVMGGYYAERAPRGWDGKMVGAAIREHYQPKGPTDDVPRSAQRVSEAVALADKLDTLREFFRIGEKPTGSGDPYALRRAALGVIRIILENELRLDLRPLAGEDGVFAFLIERLRVKLRGEGRRFDVLDAVLAADDDGDLVRIMGRVEALTDMLTAADGRDLLSAYKRAANILAKEEARDGVSHDQHYDRALLAEPAERLLSDRIEALESSAGAALADEDYEEAVNLLGALREPIDAFFEDVTVNAEDQKIRANRLRLLRKFVDQVDRIGNLSRIEG